MIPCLLCDQLFQESLQFLEIFLFSRPSLACCSSCRASFELIETEHCPTCYRYPCEEVCSDCRYWQKQGVDVQHQSLYVYNEAMANYFHRFKFLGDYVLRQVFARQLREALLPYADFVCVPIPLSYQRYAQRGFNQVTALLGAAGIPYQELLQKEERERQSSKTRQERLAIVQPFSLKEGQAVPEKILLIDDIYTTGATIQQAKSLLMKMGGKKIITFSLAR